MADDVLLDPKGMLIAALECLRDNDLDSALVWLEDLVDDVRRGGEVPTDAVNTALEALKKK